MALIPGMESIDFASLMATTIYWLLWGLLALFIGFGFIATYYWLTFNIKATVFPLYGSGKDGVFSVGKPKTNRVKATKKGNVWKSLWPIMNSKQREPFDAEFIYPGKKIYVFELNGEWSPGRINIQQTEDQIRAEINPVPYWVRNWADAESRIDEVEFSQQDWWAENKSMVYMLIAVGICCLLCGVTVYLTYEFATQGAGKIDLMTSAIKGISGAAPPG